MSTIGRRKKKEIRRFIAGKSAAFYREKDLCQTIFQVCIRAVWHHWRFGDKTLAPLLKRNEE
jgi:hypothetical protein